MSEPVQVFVRVKPEFVDSHDEYDSHSVLVPIDDKSIRISPPDGSTVILSRRSVPAVDDRIFTYDQILGAECSQEDVYELVSHQVRATVQGYNATIFALGCTGSGKTHTMTGSSSAPGIIPRAISEIFSIIESTAAREKDVFFYVRLSFVELYNNNFRNLLDFASKEIVKDRSDNSPSLLHPLVGASGTTIHRSDKIEVRESQSAGVFLAGHNLRIPVTTAQEAFRLIARGNKSRATGSTQCNDVSSRSHAILTLHVESRIGPAPSDIDSPAGSPAKPSTIKSPSKPFGVNKSKSPKGAELRLGKIHLVDLAGSERISMSGVEGDTMVETQNINLSLTALGDVLAALSKNATISANQASTASSSGMSSPGKHTMVPVPYRNSKLTHLLKDSLGGNSKTIMLTTVQSTPEYYHQTMVSLKYASRAKKVRNRSLVNRDIIGDSGIHAVSKEIERLKNRLDARSNEFNGLKNIQLRDAKENIELKRRLQEMSHATVAEKEELERQLSHVIHSQAGELVTQKKKISHLQNALQEELSISQNKIAEQEKEIIWLKKALDETSTAALQPMEQLERVQRVADAWQTQANHSQSELESTTTQMEQLRVANRKIGSELSELVEENKRLRVDLEQGQRRMDDYETTIAKSKKDRELSISQAEQYKEESLKSSQTAFQLKTQLSECTVRIATLESSLNKAEADLRDSVGAATTAAAEHTRARDALTEANHSLKRSLSETIEEIEKQMQATRDEASTELEKAESKWRQEQEKSRNAIAEVEAMKRRIVEIHGDVEHVTSQREETILSMKNSLHDLEEEKKKFLGEKQHMEKIIKGQKKELNSLRMSQEEVTEEFSIKFTELQHDLATKQKELCDIQDRHSREIEELNSKHEHQLHELHEHSTQEIVKFRDDISTSLSAQQKVLSDKHAAELARAKEVERVEIENEWMAKLVALEEALRFKEEEMRVAFLNEKQEEVAHMKEEWGAVLSEQLDAREEQHSVDMKKLTQELESEKGVELQLIGEEHSQEMASLVSAHDSDIARLQEVLASEHEKNLHEKLEEAEARHEDYIQELRAGQYTRLQESETSYELKIDNLQREISRLEELMQQTLTEAEISHEKTIDQLNQENQEKLDNAMTTFNNELEKLNKTLTATKIEEKLTLSKKHEQSLAELAKQLEMKHEKQLNTELTQLKETHQRMTEQLISQTQSSTETEWMEKLHAAQNESEARLKMSQDSLRQELAEEYKTEVEELLSKAEEGFKKKLLAQEQATLTDHQQALQLINEIHSKEKKEVAQRNDTALRQVEQSLEEDFAKRIDQLKNDYAFETKECLKERDANHERMLADELVKLRRSMEEASDVKIQFINQQLTDKYESEIEHMKKVHQEDLVKQESKLNESHDTNLQLAVQEVRQLLENLHLNETRASMEQHRIEMEQQQRMFDEALVGRIEEIRAEHDMDKRMTLDEKLEDLREQQQQALDEMKAQYAAEIKMVELTSVDGFTERLEEMKAQLVEQHEQLTSISIEDMRLKLEAQHLSDIERVGAESNEALKKMRDELERVQQEKLADQERRLREEADVEMDKREKYITDVLQKDFDLKLEDCATAKSRQHLEELEALRIELIGQHEALTRDAELEKSTQLEELRRVLNAENMSNLDSLRSELNSQHESAMTVLERNLLSQHDNAMSLLQEHIKEKEEEIEEMKISMESLKSIHLQNHEQLVNDHTQAKLKMTKSYEAKIELLRDDYNKFFEESKRNSELAAESVTRNLLHDQKIELLEAQNLKISAVKEELSSEHAQHIEALKAEHQAQLDKVIKSTKLDVQAKSNKRMDELKSQWQMDRENAEAGLRAHYKDEIGLLRVEYNRFLEESKQNVTLASEMAMKNSLQAQRAELLEAHAQNLDGVRESLGRENAAKIASLEKAHDEELKRLQLEHHNSAEEAKQLHEVAAGLKTEHALHLQKIDMEEAHKLQMLKVVADMQSDHDSQQQQARDSLERLQNDFKRTLEQSRGEAEKEYDARLTLALQECTDKLSEESTRKIRAVTQAHEEEITLIRNEYSALLEESKRNHEESTQMTLNSALESQRRELETSHLSALDVLRSTLVTKHATELSGILEEHETYIDEQTKRAEGEYQRRLSDQLSILKAHMQDEIEKADDEANRQFKVKLEKELLKLQEQAREQNEKDFKERIMMETMKLSRDHERALEAVSEQAKRESEEQQFDLQVELEELKQKYESHKTFFDNEKALNDAKIDESLLQLQNDHASEIQRLKETHSLECESLMMKNQKELDESHSRLVAEHQAAISAQVNEIRSLSDQLDQKDAIILELRSSLHENVVKDDDTLVESLRDNILKLEQQHAYAMSEVNKKHATELELLLQDKADAVEAAIAVRTATVEQQLGSELDEAVKSEAISKAALTKLQAKFDEEISSRESSLANKDTIINNLREEAEQDSKEAAATLSRMRVEHKNVLDEIAKKHSAELTDIKQQLDQSVNAFNQDSDHMRESSLKTEKQVSESFRIEKAALELEFQKNIDIQLEELRYKLEEQMKSERTKYESELDELKSDLCKEKASLSKNLEYEVQAQKELNELENRRLKEAARDELIKNQNMHFDEITSLKIQTQREISETQDKLHGLLSEARKKDETINSLTQEQHRLLDSIDAAKSLAEKEMLEIKEKMRILELEVKQNDEHLKELQHENSELTNTITSLNTEKLELVSEKEKVKEMNDNATGEHATVVKELNNQLVDSQERNSQLQNAIEDIKQKDASHSKLISDLESTIDALKTELADVALAGDHVNDTDQAVDSLKEQLQIERQRVADLTAEVNTVRETGTDSLLSKEIPSLGMSNDDEVTEVRQELSKIQVELATSRTEYYSKLEELTAEREELATKVKVLQDDVFHKDQSIAKLTEASHSTQTDDVQIAREEEQSRHVELMADLRDAYDQEILQLKRQFQEKISEQREEMQSNYLTLLQKQMANLVDVVNSQDPDSESVPKLQEMQNEFSSLVETLPESLREQFSNNGNSWSSIYSEDKSSQVDLSSDASSRNLNNNPKRDQDSEVSSLNGNEKSRHYRTDSSTQSRHIRHSVSNVSGATATWNNIHAAQHDPTSRKQKNTSQYLATSSFANNSHILKENSRTYQNSYHDNDWDSVTPMVKPISPNDQLIAAILDGDVQGVRTIVRSRGESLLSEYWRDLALSVLPLHRAISGLHFHGSDRMLINTIETLVQLGADINAQDHAGNTVLHKAIQVCTSTSVVAVVECIIRRGAAPSIRNHIGQCPIHIECSRVRTATSKVITVLLKAGVDPNVLTKASSRGYGQGSYDGDSTTLNISPLHLILQRAMSLATAQHSDDVSVSELNSHYQTTYMDDSIASTTNAAGNIPSKMRVSGLRVWVKALYTLVRAGANWNSSMVAVPGQTQLYMFLNAFPPPPEDIQLYKTLLQGALATSGMNPLTEDENGRSALFVLCERMAMTSSDKCPAAGDYLSMVLHHIPGGGIGGSDRSGRTVFDLEAVATELSFNGISCFQASRQLLLDAATARDKTRMKLSGTNAFAWAHVEEHNSASSGYSTETFRPPNDQLQRQRQSRMSVDEYVVNGVEKLSRSKF